MGLTISLIGLDSFGKSNTTLTGSLPGIGSARTDVSALSASAVFEVFEVFELVSLTLSGVAGFGATVESFGIVSKAIVLTLDVEEVEEHAVSPPRNNATRMGLLTASRRQPGARCGVVGIRGLFDKYCRSTIQR